MIEFSDSFILPERQEQAATNVPPNVASEQAFYTSELSSETPGSDSAAMAFDLETTGTNEQVQTAQDIWQEEQKIFNKDVLTSIVTDPLLSMEQKKEAVRKDNAGENISNNLKDKFIQQEASSDEAHSNRPEVPLSQQDIDAQEAWIDSINKGLDNNNIVQNLKTNFAKGLNPGIESVVGGLALDVLSVADLHNYRSLATANAVGVNVKGEDIINTGNKTLDTYIKAAAGPLFYNPVFDSMRGFFFSGTLNKKVSELYETSPPEVQKKMLTTILDELKDTPGTDFNKWLVLQEQIEDPITNPLGVAALDLLSLVGAIPIVGAIASPIRTLKWYGTIDTSSAGSTVSVPSKVTTRTEPVFTKENTPITMQEAPRTEFAQKSSGEGDINATTNIANPDIDDLDIPEPTLRVEAAKLSKEIHPTRPITSEEIIKDRANKAFTQSFTSKQEGNRMVRVNTTAFDAKYREAGDYIGAGGLNLPAEFEGKTARQISDKLQTLDDAVVRNLSEEFSLDVNTLTIPQQADEIALIVKNPLDGGNKVKYDKFSKFYADTKNIEVGNVSVDDKGAISFADGRHRYAVMRDKGLKNIPIAMDISSIINASKNGLLGTIPKADTGLDVSTITRAVRPGVAPNSQAGVLAAANPVRAANKGARAAQDLTGQQAVHLGTSRGDLYAEWALPKLDVNFVEQFPSIANRMKVTDDVFRKAFEDSAVDPFIAPITKIREETDQIVEQLRQTKGAVYNQSNSTVHFEKDKAFGLATYGRTDDYGYTTLEEAAEALDLVQKANPTFPSRVVERNGQMFIEQEWSHNFNHMNRYLFDINSMNSSFLGIDTSGISRAKHGDLIFPNTMRGDPDVAKAGFLAELNTNKTEAKFFSLLRDQILNNNFPEELHSALRRVHENQTWQSFTDLKINNPHLTQKEVGELADGYFSYKRGADYMYEFSNRLDRKLKDEKGMKAIYDRNDQLVGYGKPATGASPKLVWDYSKNTAVVPPKELNGMNIVSLEKPFTVGDDTFKHALVGGDSQLRQLPTRTLPKIEGWVPRKNVENWYVTSTPKKAKVDGEDVINEDALRSLQKTVGAGMTKSEAIQLSQKLAKEEGNANSTMGIKAAKENEGNASLTDYQAFADTIRSSRKRGERLPTLNGFSRLEDPIQAMADTSKSILRLNGWQDYKQAFQKSYMDFAGKFTEGTFPNNINQLRPLEGSTLEELTEFKVAQRLFEQYSNQQFMMSSGDQIWKGFFHGVADTLEDVKFVGKEMAELSRGTARQGNLPVRAAKSLATNLFINLNPARQWVVQPQQLMELNLISPGYATKAPTEVPAVIMGILSRAPHLGTSRPVAFKAAQKFSGMGEKEFKELVDIVYDSGLPQAVDLNSMLLGTLEQAKMTLDPTVAQQMGDLFSNTVKLPGKAGKSIGYTPAEMANNIGTWLFTKNRFEEANPGVDWRLPENVARITADSWDIAHSMIGRSGAFPYQDGLAGVFFQFHAVQQKSFMQLLSSKTLSKDEKMKMAAARLALYGQYGLPAGVVLGVPISDFIVDNTASEETKAAYHRNKTGMIDWAVNNLLDIWTGDENRSDIAISKALSPIPDTVPILDLLIEMTKFTDNNQPNPRFPFTAALGSLGEAGTDIHSLWAVSESDTKDKLIAAGREIVQLASGMNNWEKAMMIKNYRDKMNKKGQFYGLDLNEADMVAQVFGIITREEETHHLVNNMKFERQAAVKRRSKEVVEQLQKVERRIGTPDWSEHVRRSQILNEFSDEDLQRDVRMEAEKQMKFAKSKKTGKESSYEFILRHHKDKTDERTGEMIELIKRNAETNEADRLLLERLRTNGLID